MHHDKFLATFIHKRHLGTSSALCHLQTELLELKLLQVAVGKGVC